MSSQEYEFEENSIVEIFRKNEYTNNKCIENTNRIASPLSIDDKDPCINMPQNSSTMQVIEKRSFGNFQKKMKLFFRGLRKTTSRETIYSVLSQYGNIKAVKVPFSKVSQKNMGYGYVIYQNKEVSINLLNNIRTVFIQGKSIPFSVYDPRVKNSFKASHPENLLGAGVSLLRDKDNFKKEGLRTVTIKIPIGNEPCFNSLSKQGEGFIMDQHSSSRVDRQKSFKRHLPSASSGKQSLASNKSTNPFTSTTKGSMFYSCTTHSIKPTSVCYSHFKKIDLACDLSSSGKCSEFKRMIPHESSNNNHRDQNIRYNKQNIIGRILHR